MAEEDKVVVRCDCNTTMRPNWSDLQLELLELILKRLAVVDIARFKLVSSSWYAAAKSYISGPVYKPLLPQTPWLMLPRERGDVDAGRFFSLSEKKVYTFKNLFQGFVGEEERCLVGSSYGWLVMWDLTALRLHLFNPISGVRIKLPPLGSGPMPRVRRVILSSDPSLNKKFYVVAIYLKILDAKLAFHKHGDDGDNTTWTDLDSVPDRYDKIIFQNGLLFALSLGEDSKSILVWDFRGTYPCRSMEFQPPEREVGKICSALYLVESLGEFLLVENLGNPDSGLFYYDVHKLNFTPNRVECLKVKCLQNQALVLSENQSATMSLSTLDFPELEANSIYVARECFSFERTISFALYSKVEAYNLESKGSKSYFTSEVERPIMNSPLVWIVPNPCQAANLQSWAPSLQHGMHDIRECMVFPYVFSLLLLV